MKIAVLGYGKQGQSAVNYWGKGNDITVCDKNTELELPSGVEHQTGDDYLAGLDQFNLIIRSPAVHPRDIVAANDERILRKVTTVTEEFFRVCPAPIIGVTGTKGKGTTSSLITKILETDGKKVHLGGNIGTPPLDMLASNIQPSDWVVLELANFQLIDLGVSPKIAVCLMVVPEHLDWHTDIAEYLKAKQQLFIHQNPKDLAIFNRKNDFSSEVVGVSPALKLSYEVPEAGEQPIEKNGAYVLGEDIYMDDERVCSIHDVALLGRHNLQNVCAAIAATWDIIGNNAEVITNAVKDFSGLPHRIEPVKTVNEVTFYNDSFATAAGATIAAINAIANPKVLIIGGFDRGLDLSSLSGEIVKHTADIRSVLLIGATIQRMKSELDKVGYSNYKIVEAKDMQSIVEAARNEAQPGDAVIFSPGFASFDMFKNFEDRGLQYKACVDKL
ncbi:MAG: UDP-N-acetylmuramoylalanine--D-glutamate ligase [Patescibacteria group bacterium]|nr:UDP-N-acetylmuramoylalanine--D-glutamate ligase [Patescibacteria group bacterium]